MTDEQREHLKALVATRAKLQQLNQLQDWLEVQQEPVVSKVMRHWIDAQIERHMQDLMRLDVEQTTLLEAMRHSLEVGH